MCKNGFGTIFHSKLSKFSFLLLRLCICDIVMLILLIYLDSLNCKQMTSKNFNRLIIASFNVVI